MSVGEVEISYKFADCGYVFTVVSLHRDRTEVK